MTTNPTVTDPRIDDRAATPADGAEAPEFQRVDPAPAVTTSDIAASTATPPAPAAPPASPAASASNTAPDQGTGRAATPEPQQAPLFDDTAAGELRARWLDVQTGFVDEPRTAVEQADTLVAEVMKRLAEGFASERTMLEQQWSRGDDVSTEDLRVALRRYRSFFDRLLSL